MADKIKVEVEHKQAVSALKEVQTELKNTSAAAKQVGQDVGGSALDAADKLIDKLDAAEAAEAATANLGKIGIALGAVTAAVAAAGGAWEAFQSVVKSSAEGGDAEAQRLVKAAESVGTAWEDAKRRIGETNLFQNLMGSVTEFNKELATTASTLGHLAIQMEARKLGVDPEEWDKVVQKQLDLNEARKQGGEVAKVLAEFDQQERRDRLQDDAKKFKTLDEVKKAIEDERAAILKRSATGMTDATSRENALAKLNALRVREKQIVKENEQAEKDAAREKEQAAKKAAHEQEKAAKEAADTAKREAEIMERFKERELEKRVQTIRDALAAELKADAEAKAMRLKMDAEYQKARDNLLKALGQDPGIQAAAQQVAQQASDPRAIARRLADDAAATNRAQQATNAKPTDERAVQEARRTAYRQAINQLNGRGPQGDNAIFSPDQILSAQNKNAQALLKNVGENKNVSAENIDATQMLAQEYQNNSAELAQLSGQVQTIMKQVGLVAQQNQRRRSQSGVSTP